MESTAMQWLAALALLSVPLAGLALVWFASRGRLVRCPETGGIGFVDVALPAAGRRQEARPEIRRCDLWPQRKGCAQGCLARHPETAARYRVDLNALHPFRRT